MARLPTRDSFSLLALGVTLIALGACGNIVVPESSGPGPTWDDPTPDAGGGGGGTDDEADAGDTGSGGDGGPGSVNKCGDDAACDDDDPCTEDHCNADGECEHPAAPDVCSISGVCYADGATSDANLCKVCDPTADAGAWTDVVCADEEACTIDGCDPDSGCTFDPEADGTACELDGDSATPDVCDGGICVTTCACQVDADCDGAVATGDCERAVCDGCECLLTSDLGKDGEPCDDHGDLCISGATCQAGQCAGGTTPDCSSEAQGPCQPGVCDSTTGQCVTGAAGAETGCDDGDPCTQADSCDGAGGCAGQPLDCTSFEGACASASCVAGACQTQPLAGEPCDPGNPCIAGATCQPNGQCVGAWDTEECPCVEDGDCDDGKPCTDDSCDADTGACAQTPIAGGCYIDGKCFWGGEPNLGVNTCQVCDPGVSQTTWASLACDDGNPCTSDQCDPAAGCVTSALDGNECQDDDPCTKDETCVGGICEGLCTCTLDAHCEGSFDEVPACMRPACINFDCYLEPDPDAEGQACEDGDLCTAGDTCEAGGCASGAPVVCEAEGSSECSQSQCNPGTGDCQVAYAQSGAPCNDGDPCTQGDACDGGGLCAGAAKDCSSFADTCNDAACEAGVCVPTPKSGGGCDDGQTCTVQDTCDLSGDCAGTWDASLPDCVCLSDADCDDGLACTADTCAGSGACVYTTTPGSCLVDGVCYASGEPKAGNACLLCAPAASQSKLQSKACNDQNPCTDDACDPASGCTAAPNDALACDDHDPCTHDDHCSGGACQGASDCIADSDCGAAGAPCLEVVCDCGTCTFVPAFEGQDCDDGKHCTVGEVCLGGTCAGGQPLDCSEAGDGDCVVGSCDDTVDACVGEAAADGIFCDDGDGCTVADHCVGGACVADPMDCTEWGDGCNAGLCANGHCAAQPTVGAQCDDGSGCTLADKCDPNGQCVGTWDEENCGCTEDADCAAEFAADPCREGRCDVTNHTCYGEAQIGASCDDEAPCTYNDACTGTGACSGTQASCSDGFSCTADLCDGAGGCDNPVLAGTCLIGGKCFNAGQPNPGNPCQICQGGTSWSDQDGVACEDGDPCTSDDSCSGGACAGAAYACEVSPCQTATCDGDGGCDVTLKSGWCFIANTCVASGAAAGDNPCKACVPSQSTTWWSSVSGACDDGNACTSGDACAGGVCAGTAYSCNDQKPCTVDSCNADDDGCTHTTAGGWCLIGSTCHSDGALKTGSDCEHCDSSQSVGAWSPTPEGSACTDGLACTTGDACNGEGLCEGSLEGCAALSCETPTCNAAGGCDVELKAGWCRIDDACWLDGASPDGDACQVCDVTTSPYAWTALAGSCDDGDPCTGPDVCAASGCTGTPMNCADALPCTQDSCSPQGKCEHTPDPGFCVIDDACVAAGTAAAGGCQLCDPGVNVYGWTWAAEGAACEDDGLSCTVDACASGVCGHPPAASTGQCLIGLGCVAGGTSNPLNTCQWCDPGTAVTAYVAKPAGSTCTDDGNTCTTDVCSNNGKCSHPMLEDYVACEDGASGTAGDWCWHGICGGFSRQSVNFAGNPQHFNAAEADADVVHASLRANNKLAALVFKDGQLVTEPGYLGNAATPPGLQQVGLAPPWAVVEQDLFSWDGAWTTSESQLGEEWAHLEPSPNGKYWGAHYQHEYGETLHAVGRDAWLPAGLVRRCWVETVCTVACFEQWKCSVDPFVDPKNTWPVDAAFVDGVPYVAANLPDPAEVAEIQLFFFEGKYWVPVAAYAPYPGQRLLAFESVQGVGIGIGSGMLAFLWKGGDVTPVLLPLPKGVDSDDGTLTDITTRDGRIFISGFHERPLISGTYEWGTERTLQVWHADDGADISDPGVWIRHQIAQIEVDWEENCGIPEDYVLNALASQPDRMMLFGGWCSSAGKPNAAWWSWEQPQ